MNLGGLHGHGRNDDQKKEAQAMRHIHSIEMNALQEIYSSSIVLPF